MSTELSSKDAQQIFHDIVFRKQVTEGLKEAANGELTDWDDLKKEIRAWYN